MIQSDSYRYPTASANLGEEERAAMLRVMESGRHTMGPEAEALEAELAGMHGRRFAVTCNSGSSANLLAVAAMFHLRERRPLYRHDLAVAPAVAWGTTYAPLVQHGIKFSLADVDNTWCAPVPEEIGPAGLRLVVACSILGNPGYLREWKNRVRSYDDCFLLNDNCESIGATTEGRPAGSFGDASTLSFFWSHQVCGLEGGAVLTDDPEIDRWCRVLRDHGLTRSVNRDKTVDFGREYEFVAFGYNLRPLEMACAVARVQLGKLPETIARRRANLDYFWGMARELDLPIAEPLRRGAPSPFGVAFEVEELASLPQRRARIVRSLREAGVDCRLPTGGSFMQHEYSYRMDYDGWDPRSHPTSRADAVHRCGLFFGCPPHPAAYMMEIAARAIRGAL